jgi:prolyl-tRNA editing enzyme YbaK/EbsC (Cys-tRNA(Pro) deacylase)
MGAGDSASVSRLKSALLAAGSTAEVVELADTARTAEDAARALGVDVAAIVKSLVFRIDEQPVMALVAGDRRCRVELLPTILRLTGKAERADAAFVRSATGYAIGGVAPLGHVRPVPTVLDVSLGRFQTVYAAAGHPHCVFPTSLAELQHLTNGTLSEEISKTHKAETRKSRY